VSVVELEKDGPVALCTLNRPKQLNAMNREVVGELVSVFDDVAGDDAVKVLVLKGAGRAFCAGYDLAEEAGERIEGAADWHGALAADVRMTMRLWSLEKPTIAAVHGWCLAGGCELAMACDMIVAAESARFGEPEIRYGSGPVALLMPFVIGQKKTNELLFTGDAIDAAEAERIGLVNRVVEDGDLEASAMGLARKIAVAPLPVLKLTKLGLLRAFTAAGLVQAVDNNLDLSAILNAAGSPEQVEFDSIVATKGLKAALAWRDSRYGGALGSS
jgi:enoyl-CoA hydratase